MAGSYIEMALQIMEFVVFWILARKLTSYKSKHLLVGALLLLLTSWMMSYFDGGLNIWILRGSLALEVFYLLNSFKEKLERTLVVFLLGFFSVTLLQFVSTLSFSRYLSTVKYGAEISAVIGTITFLLSGVIYLIVTTNILREIMSDKKPLYRASFILIISISFYALIKWRSDSIAEATDFAFIIGTFIALFVVSTLQQRSYFEYLRFERDVKLYHQYADSMSDLISDIRAKQHEFDNHLNALSMMAYSYSVDSIDELAAEQQKYIINLKNDNRYLTILKIEKSPIAGFLYGKLINAEARGITVDIDVVNFEIATKLQDHQLIEILGSLIDNAIEAEPVDNPNIKVKIEYDADGHTSITVMNRHAFVRHSELVNFFKRGFSTKGSGTARGLGLYNVYNIVTKVRGVITVGNVSINGDNYISFSLTL